MAEGGSATEGTAAVVGPTDVGAYTQCLGGYTCMYIIIYLYTTHTYICTLHVRMSVHHMCIHMYTTCAHIYTTCTYICTPHVHTSVYVKCDILKVHLAVDLDLTRFAIQAKGPDGKWTRKPLAYRESNNVHLLIARPPEICVNPVFKRIHAASIYTV